MPLFKKRTHSPIRDSRAAGTNQQSSFRPLEAGRKIVEEAGEIAKQQKIHGQTAEANKSERELEEMLQEQRIKRLEKLVSALEPGKKQKVQEFMEQLMKQIQQWDQQGIPVQQIAKTVEHLVEKFWEQKELYPDSPLNKERVLRVMNFLNANELIQ